MRSTVRFELRDFDERAEAAYARLFPGDSDKTPELLAWRSDCNPHGASRFAVAVDDDHVIGMVALIPTRLTGGLLGYQAVDTAVDPAYRGQGLFVGMGRLAQQELSANILWGFPNANAAPGWFGRLGWTNFGKVPLMIRPLRAGFLWGRLHPWLRALDFPLIGGPRVAAHRYQDGDGFAADFEPLWRCVRPELGTAVERSGAWMRWRLFDKPGADYRIAGTRSEDGRLAAFVATKVADKHGARLAYCMEALSLPGRTSQLADLLHAELSRAAQEGAGAALAWCPAGAPNRAAYRKAGFVSFPAKLRPVEINFGARALRPGAAGAVAAPWFLSFLDSDTN